MPLIVLAIFLCFVSLQANAEAQIPEFAKQYIGSHSPEMRFFEGELNAWGKSFSKFNTNPDWSSPTPWAVNLDFNGDSKIDWVGFLVRRDENYYSNRATSRLDLVCICSGLDGYSFVEILRSAGSAEPEHMNYGVYSAGRGQISGVEGEVANLPYEGVHFIVHGGTSRVFYWNGSSVSTLWTSD